MNLRKKIISFKKYITSFGVCVCVCLCVCSCTCVFMHSAVLITKKYFFNFTFWGISIFTSSNAGTTPDSKLSSSFRFYF